MAATSQSPGTLCSVTPSPRWQLDCIWEANTLDLQQKKFFPPIAPTWRLLLLNDGYTTRNLGLLAGEEIEVRPIASSIVTSTETDAPAAVSLLENPNVRRQVMLHGVSGQPLMYGVSWWNAETMKQHLRHPDRPIGRNLSNLRTELFREMHGLYLGHSAELEREFDAKGPFWGRHYVLWHQQRPLTLIVEIFSNVITRYIGHSQPPKNILEI